MKMFLFLLLVSFNTVAYAIPKAPVDDLNFNPSKYLKISSYQIENYDFEGIVKLSNCSGSLVQFEGQPNSDFAVVMTNGHCIPRGPLGGMLRPGEVVVNQKIARDMKIFKTKTALFPIKTSRVLYATMTNTDVAFYELTESFAQVEKRTGVRPFALAPQRPVEKTPIQIISGYWERGYSCAVDGFVKMLKEADWTFTDSVRYTDGCDTIGGTSGSPIIEAGTRSVIAINNTSNESGERCTMNNPCEVGANGDIFVKKGLRYGQQTYEVYACLDRHFQFDLKQAGCTLPRK